VAVGWAGAVAELADGLAADASAPEAAVDDVLGLQAASASPMPRPSTEMPAVLAAGMKCPKFIVAVVLIVVMDRA